MYVIFPADEIVYLSYGHLIYVPSTPQPDNELRTPPIRSSLDEHPPFSRTSVNSSNQSEEPKEKPRSVRDWDRFDCIGSRSIDLESRSSVDRSRTNGLIPEPRTPEPSQLISRSDLINRSGITRNQVPIVPKISKNITPEPSTSGFRSGAVKTSDQSESRHTFDRYRTPNRSLKAKTQIENQQPDHFKIFSTANKPKKPLKPLEATVQNPRGFRLGSINKPPRSQKSESGQSPIENLSKDLLETELVERQEFNRFESSNRSIKVKNQSESENITFGGIELQEFNKTNTLNRSVRSKNSTESDLGYKSVELAETGSLLRLGSTSKSLKTKNQLETEIVRQKTPDPSESGSLPRPKTSSRFLRATEEGSGNFERAYNSNSNKSSKSSKNSSNSSRSSGIKATGTRPRTVSDSINSRIEQPKKKFSTGSFRSFLRSVSKEKTPEPPVRPERKREKRGTDPRLSESLTINRELVSRSDIINTRSDQVQDVKSEKPVIKREKSPVIRFFRAQSSSPRTLNRDKTAFDFDELFKQDPKKLNVYSESVGNKTYFGSDTDITKLGCKLSEKSKTKKRVFFRRKISPSSDKEANMAGNESPLKDLIHPAYNEHLKSHNAVTFKLIRTGRT